MRINMEQNNNPSKIQISPQMLEKTWVYDGREYKLTGRVASQEIRPGKVKILLEIMALSFAKNSPTNINYNKWVRQADLFTISGENVLIKPKEE